MYLPIIEKFNLRGIVFVAQRTCTGLHCAMQLQLLLFRGTSKSMVALANARDLSESQERMPKSTMKQKVNETKG